MGFLLSLFLVSALAAFLAYLVVSHLTRRSANSRAYSVSGASLTFVVLVAILTANFSNIMGRFTRFGSGVSVEEANKHLFAFKLPPEATDVDYFCNPCLGNNVADFKIDEESFLAWAAENGWEMERFVTEERVANQESKPDLPEDASLYTLESFPRTAYVTRSFVDPQSEGMVEICNGYFCSTYPPDSDAGEEIYYDIDSLRAYIHSSLH